MKTLRKVIWAEGMFLGQQHFQLLDQYHETCRSLQGRCYAPLSWGVVSLDYDKQALENGVYRVKSCQVIFPDGHIINYLEADDNPLTLELKGNESGQVEVYLGLPANRSASGINGYKDNGKLCAWRVDYAEVDDENDPERGREVMLGRPNLFLFDGEAGRENFTWIKLAELHHDGDQQYCINEKYIPPLACISASETLSELTVRLVELFRAKIRSLNERRRQSSASVAEFGHSDLTNFLVLHTLSSALPELQHYRNYGELHPEGLYILLSRIVGGLAPFSIEIEAQSIPRYQHESLSATFQSLEQQIRALFDMAMPSKIAPIKLARESDVLYSIDAVDSSHLKCGLYLAVKSDSEDPMWMKSFERMTKIGSRGDIEMIVASALPGVRVVHTQRPPSNLPIKSGYEYFRVEKKGDFWEKIENEKTLGLFVSREFSGVPLEMLAIQE